MSDMRPPAEHDHVNTGEWPPVMAWLDSLADGGFYIPVGSRPPITRKDDHGTLHVCCGDRRCEDAAVGDTIVALDDGTFDVVHADQLAEAFRGQLAHAADSWKVDRRGWTRAQWIADVRRLFNDLDGSVLDLVNGHVQALLDEIDDGALPCSTCRRNVP